MVSRSGANFSHSALVPMVVPRAQLEEYGGEAYRQDLTQDTLPTSKMLKEKDAAGNTVRALMLSAQIHTKTLALAPARKTPKHPPPPTLASLEARMIKKLRKEVIADNKLTAIQLVEKYRPQTEAMGAKLMTGAARQAKNSQKSSTYSRIS